MLSIIGFAVMLIGMSAFGFIGVNDITVAIYLSGMLGMLIDTGLHLNDEA